MGYATVMHVKALCPQRRFTASSIPSEGDVIGFLDDAAAELDAILRSVGYQLPVPPTSTGALGVLRRANAAGAAHSVEVAAPTNKEGAEKRYAADWNALQAQLDPNRRGPTIELDLPRNRADSYARAQTMADLGRSASSVISRYMQL